MQEVPERIGMHRYQHAPMSFNDKQGSHLDSPPGVALIHSRQEAEDPARPGLHPETETVEVPGPGQDDLGTAADAAETLTCHKTTAQAGHSGRRKVGRVQTNSNESALGASMQPVAAVCMCMHDIFGILPAQGSQTPDRPG